MTDRAYRASFLTIFLLGLMIRCWPLAGLQPYWLDEVVSLTYASRSLPQLIRDVAAHDAHPPLYYLCLHFWICLGRSAYMVRLLSGLIASMTLLIAMLLAHRIFPRTGALLYGLLLSLSSHEAYFSHEARHYALAGLCVMFAAERFLQAEAEDGVDRRKLISIGIATVGAFYTFYYAVFPLLWIWIVLCFRAKKWAHAKWPYAACILLICLCCLPWMSVVRARMALHDDLVVPEGTIGLMMLLDAFVQMLLGILPGLSSLKNAAPAWFALAGLLMAVHHAQRHHAIIHLWGMTVSTVLCVVLLPYKMHVFQGKHLAFLSPLVLMLVLVRMQLIARKRYRVLMFACCLSIVLPCNLAGLEFLYSKRFIKENWPALTARMHADYRVDDLVILSPGYIRHPFQLYFQDAAANVLQIDMATQREDFQRRSIGVKRVWFIEDHSPVSAPSRKPHAWLKGAWTQDREQSYIFQGYCGTLVLYLYTASDTQ